MFSFLIFKHVLFCDTKQKLQTVSWKFNLTPQSRPAATPNLSYGLSARCRSDAMDSLEILGFRFILLQLRS